MTKRYSAMRTATEGGREEEENGGLSSMRYRKADNEKGEEGWEGGVTDLGCHGVGESLSPSAVLITVKPTTHGCRRSTKRLVL